MLKRCQLFLMIVSLSIIAGCGTLVTRSDPYYATQYYKGTHMDLALLFNGDSLNSSYVPFTLWCWLSIICPVATVYSLPVDIAVDTVLIPYDAYNTPGR